MRRLLTQWGPHAVANTRELTHPRFFTLRKELGTVETLLALAMPPSNGFAEFETLADGHSDATASRGMADNQPRSG